MGSKRRSRFWVVIHSKRVGSYFYAVFLQMFWFIECRKRGGKIRLTNELFSLVSFVSSFYFLVLLYGGKWKKIRQIFGGWHKEEVWEQETRARGSLCVMFC